MSLWRRKALALFPQLRAEIASADGAAGVAFQLRVAVMEAYHREPLDEEFLASAYDYAWWFLSLSPATEDAALCSFYGGIVRNEATRRDLNRWLTPEQFYVLSGEFEYHLGSQFGVFEREFLSGSRTGNRSG